MADMLVDEPEHDAFCFRRQELGISHGCTCNYDLLKRIAELEAKVARLRTQLDTEFEAGYSRGVNDEFNATRRRYAGDSFEKELTAALEQRRKSRD